MRDPYQCSRTLYLCEATLEYLVAVLAVNPFLAVLTTEMGMSDSLTGVIASIATLGYVFQAFSILIHPKRSKPFVIILSVSNQLLFTLMYVIPMLNLGRELQAVLFTAVIILAYLLYNLAHPKKVNWFMSLVDEHSRGRFTANKEILFLTAGMVCTYVMGIIVDNYKAKGNVRHAFVICTVTLLIITLLHTMTMIFSVERTDLPVIQRGSFLKNLSSLLRDKRVLRVTGVSVLLNLAVNVTNSFYGTYQIKELGFSLQTVSIVIILSSIARILVSRFWGAYADKHSFVKMSKMCFCLQAISFLICMFAVPANGIIVYTAFSILYWIAWGGINSATVNLVYEYVPAEKCEDALALSQAAGGLTGFVTTAVTSYLVSYIQTNGNRLFGLHIYAQQVTSFLAFLLTVILILYTDYVLLKNRKRRKFRREGLRS